MRRSEGPQNKQEYTLSIRWSKHSAARGSAGGMGNITWGRGGFGGNGYINFRNYWYVNQYFQILYQAIKMDIISFDYLCLFTILVFKNIDTFLYISVWNKLQYVEWIHVKIVHLQMESLQRMMYIYRTWILIQSVPFEMYQQSYKILIHYSIMIVYRVLRLIKPKLILNKH